MNARPDTTERNSAAGARHAGTADARCRAPCIATRRLYEDEIRRIFFKSWLYVGHAEPDSAARRLFPVRHRRRVRDRRARRRGPDQRSAERVPAPRIAHLRRSRPGAHRGSCAAITAGRMASTARCAPQATRLRTSTIEAGAAPAAHAGCSSGSFSSTSTRRRAPFEAIADDLAAPWLPTLWSAARSHTARTIPSPVTGSSPSRTTASAITARRRIRNIPLDTGARFPCGTGSPAP